MTWRLPWQSFVLATRYYVFAVQVNISREKSLQKSSSLFADTLLSLLLSGTSDWMIIRFLYRLPFFPSWIVDPVSTTGFFCPPIFFFKIFGVEILYRNLKKKWWWQIEMAKNCFQRPYPVGDIFKKAGQEDFGSQKFYVEKASRTAPLFQLLCKQRGRERKGPKE